MSTIKYLIFTVLAFTIVLFNPVLSRAQSPNKIGIIWNPPKDLSTARGELQLFEKSGIEDIMFQKQIRPAIMDMLKHYSFKLYISIPNRFVTTSDLQDHPKDILKKCQSYISYYDHNPNIVAYGLFEYGENDNLYFIQKFNNIIDSLRAQTQHPFYYLTEHNSGISPSSDFNFSIKIVKDSLAPKLSHSAIKGGVSFRSSSEQFDLKNLEKFFRDIHMDENAPIFFNSDWLFHLYKQNIQIFKYLSVLSLNPHAIFSIPAPHPPKPKSNWIVILLLLVWGIIAVHYAFEPNYRKSLQRYFNNHIFFVNDIIERHARLSTSGFIVILLQSVMGGMFIYSIFNYSFSNTGFKAFIHHYPFIGFLNGSPLSLLFLGFGALLLYNLICIIWLYFGIPDISYFSQAVTLHMWTQHINVIIFSIILTLIMASSSIIVIYILGMIFIMFILMSFYITVVDTVKFSETPLIQHLVTSVPHFILLVTMLLWLILGTNLINVWHFAMTLT